MLRVPRRVPWHDERRAGFFAAQLALILASRKASEELRRLVR